jgi:hypothetical protein
VFVSLCSAFAPTLFHFFSDKTDVDSTHSSSCISHHGSVYHVENGKGKGDLHHIKKSENLVIPPDALYGHQHPHNHPQTSYISYEAVFNDSKVSFLFCDTGKDLTVY